MFLFRDGVLQSRGGWEFDQWLSTATINGDRRPPKTQYCSFLYFSQAASEFLRLTPNIAICGSISRRAGKTKNVSRISDSMQGINSWRLGCGIWVVAFLYVGAPLTFSP